MTPEGVRNAVHEVVQRFQDAQVEGDLVAETLMSYAIAIWNDTHGSEDTARHLYMMAMGMRAGLDAQVAAAEIERAATGGRTH